MSISFETHPNGQLIRVLGPLDAAAAEDARRVFLEVLDAGTGEVGLDLSATDFLDSSGIGAIVFLYKRLVLQGRILTLHNLAGQPKDLIGLLRLDRTIPTAPLAA